MHFETRLWQFTKGVRLRMVYTVLIGLVAACFGIARLTLLGWLIGRIFAGDSLQELLLPVLAMALVIVLRGALDHWRALVAHATAARVQLRLRRRLFDKVTELGPSYVERVAQLFGGQWGASWSLSCLSLGAVGAVVPAPMPFPLTCLPAPDPASVCSDCKRGETGGRPSPTSATDVPWAC